jgi:GNAT superfamily N-acetyltransferase
VQEDGRHIVAYGPQGKPVGYCHYRWETDPLDEEKVDKWDLQVPVGYIYELQLHANVRGLGLASHLMETIATWVSNSQYLSSTFSPHVLKLFYFGRSLKLVCFEVTQLRAKLLKRLKVRLWFAQHSWQCASYKRLTLFGQWLLEAWGYVVLQI